MSNTVAVVSQRTFVLPTTAGRSFAFTKGVPVQVPRAILEEVMRSGVVPVEEDDLPTFNPEAVAPDNSPVDPAVRRSTIKAALAQLRKINNREDFAASGQPKVGAVERVLGFQTSAKEIAPILQEMHDEETAAVEEDKQKKAK